MVVLDQYGRARRRLTRQCLGEQRVVALVGQPVLLEHRPEGRLGGRGVQKMQDEPERTVGDRVVRPLEHDPVHIEHAHRGTAGVVASEIEPAVRGQPGGPPVGFAQRRAHPHQPAATGGIPGGISAAGRGILAHHRVQTADQPTTATTRDQGPVIVRAERHRPTVGRDEHAGRPDSRGTRRFVNPRSTAHIRRLGHASKIFSDPARPDHAAANNVIVHHMI